MKLSNRLLVVAAAIALVAAIIWIQFRPDADPAQANSSSAANEQTVSHSGSATSDAVASEAPDADPVPVEQREQDATTASSTDGAASNEGEAQAAEGDAQVAKADPAQAEPVLAKRPKVDVGELKHESVNEVLNDAAVDWQDPKQRAEAVARMKDAQQRELEIARALARQQGLPLREELPNDKVRELVGIDRDTGHLKYYETKNKNAAISTGANLINQAPYNLDGTDLLVGVWDEGVVRVTHQEFNDGGSSRSINRDGAGGSNHGTHVGGTIGAFGVQANAKGMANQATIWSYDWFSDFAEMTGNGASNAGQHASKVYLSNHSYGYSYGWRPGGFTGGWAFFGTGNDQNAYDPDFGRYSNFSSSLDALLFNTPYYTVFWAAGNENTDGPANGQGCTINGSAATYNSAIHPQNDGQYRNGFETIGDMGVAKNCITIGAANDAVTGGLRDPSKSTKTNFSCTGPTDDGRIKPDLIANGANLYSPVNGNNTAYASYSGTSMASPNACGSAALLVEFYRELFGSSAAMRASTLKALLIHTATDVGNPGPDYTHGWGLVDVKTAADLLQDQKDHSELQVVTEDQLTTSATDTYTFVWDGSSPIRATLCWTDPAIASQSGHDNRTPDLVNDLNLKLTAPDGTTEYFPFVMPFVGTWTVDSMSENATTGVNNTDNVEQVLVSAPDQTGVWTVEVTHNGALTNGSQNYSLIISGESPQGALVFLPPNYRVDEDGTSVTVSVERVGGLFGAASVDFTTVDGTALAGSDYTTTTGTLSWASEEGGSKDIVIPILNDAVPEDYEKLFTVALSNAVNANASSASAKVTIVDDETIIGVIDPNGGDGESFNGGATTDITWVSSLVGGTVRIELLKNGVNYMTIASSTDNDGTFSWTVPQNASTGDDYRVRITNLAGGGEFDTSNEDFSINNDFYDNPAGELSFSVASLTVTESSGSAVVTVERNGATTGAVSVDYATSDGTAVAGSDYAAVSGTLNWASGDGASKAIIIPIINDAIEEDFIESLQLALTNTVGATLLSPNPITLEIQDDDNLALEVEAGKNQLVWLEPGAPWTPQDIVDGPSNTLKIWLDAMDTDTLTLAGSKVAQWDDKSGFGNHAYQTDESSGWRRPTYANNKVTFDGDAQLLRVTNDPFKGLQKFAVIAMQRWHSSRSYYNTTASYSYGVGDGWLLRQYQADVSRLTFTRVGTGGVNDPSPTATNNLANHIAVGYRKDSAVNLGSSTVKIRHNGSETYNWADDSGSITYGGSNRSAIGGRYHENSWGGAPQGYLDGDLMEVVVINNANDDQVLRTEGYLAHKWGEENRLPNDHPYKDEAPIGEGVSVTVDLSSADVAVNEGPLTSTEWTVASTIPSGIEEEVTFDDASVVDTTATFTAQGVYTLRLTTSNGSETFWDEVVITVGPTPSEAYELWTGGSFFEAFPITAPGNDFDGDGWINFVEFAFGMDPTDPLSHSMDFVAGGSLNTPGLPVLHNDGGYEAVFTRRKDHATAGVTYTVWFSCDLGIWTSSAVGMSVVATSPGDYEAVSVPFPASVPTQTGGTDAPKFFRVEVRID